MRMNRNLLLCAFAAVSAAGCASQDVWVGGNGDFEMDKGQCQAQAFSIPNAPPMQAAIVFNSCMRGKGWHLERQSR